MDAAQTVKNSKAKVLIIHGEDDTLVPCKFSQRVKDENPDKVTYCLVKHAEHGISYIVDKPLYRKAVRDFLNS